MPGKRVRCKACGDVIQSMYRHDLHHCECKAIYVDGGEDYLRVGWPDGKWEDHGEVLDGPLPETPATDIEWPMRESIVNYRPFTPEESKAHQEIYRKLARPTGHSPYRKVED